MTTNGVSMKEMAASAVKATPPVGANVWLWLAGHDINWWVALLTIGYIVLQAFYLIKNNGRRGRYEQL
jgi:hypothetical protein